MAFTGLVLTLKTKTFKSMSHVNTTKVKIIMPSVTLFETDATMVNIPGGEGMFGVLPGHVKLISTIQIGVVSIFANNLEQKFFVYGGLAEVNGTEVNIVTEFAVPLEGQSKTDILNKIVELKAELEAADNNDLEAGIIKSSIDRYNSLLTIIG
jgi:F-type H+-transporting ATPase subunit epsilon